MDPVWLDHYPPGVPTDCVVGEDETLIQAFEAAVAKWPANPAFSNLGHTLTFADTDRLSRLFAAYMQNELGLKARRQGRVDDAEYSAIPGRFIRLSARGPDCRQCESTVYNHVS